MNISDQLVQQLVRMKTGESLFPYGDALCSLRQTSARRHEVGRFFEPPSRSHAMTHLTRRALLAAGSAALLGPALLARAATWPSHLVRIIVPFSAGAATDLLTRQP